MLEPRRSSLGLDTDVERDGHAQAAAPAGVGFVGLEMTDLDAGALVETARAAGPGVVSFELALEAFNRDLSGEQILGLEVVLELLGSRISGMQAQLAARLLDCAQVQGPRHAAHELAGVLHKTVYATKTMVQVGELASRRADFTAALDRGLVDATKAGLVARSVDHVDQAFDQAEVDGQVRGIAAQLLGRHRDQAVGEVVSVGVASSRQHTHRQVSRDLELATAQIDPEGWTAAHRRAYHGRYVSLDHLEHGMGVLRMVGAYPEVRQVFDHLTDTCERDPSAESKTRDNARYDLAVAALLTPSFPTLIRPEPYQCPTCQAHRNHDAEHGPDEAEFTPRCTPANTTPTAPGATQTTATSCPPCDQATGLFSPTARLAIDQSPKPGASFCPPPKPRMYITIDYATLLGLNDDPALILGTGPIAAHAARELATNSTWKLLITDPTTRRLITLGDKTHPPGTTWEVADPPDPPATNHPPPTLPPPVPPPTPWPSGNPAPHPHQ
ncbi:MAG: hypothetical protein FWD59_08320, partial [Micrococcales bacterium]|nr:hypothetical protein [Micrococcales bacterium]